MGRLTGKVVIVTGGARGLGKASAEAMINEGANVVLTDVDADLGNDTAKTFGDQALFLHHDVGDHESWGNVIKTTYERFGTFDALLNNAGVVRVGDIVSTTEEDWRLIQRVNCDGVFFGCQHAVRAMRKTGGGSIINMSSTSAIRGYPLVFAYAATKGAVLSMTLNIAAFASFNFPNIRCNAIVPGPIATELLASAESGASANDPVADVVEDEFAMSSISGSPKVVGAGEPSDVANMAVYLASDESRFINGAQMVVDGGGTMIGPSF